MKKNRIVTRVKDKTGIAKSKNRSEDLVELRTQYASFGKNLKFLITTLTNNQSAMINYSKARLEVAKAVNSLTVDTPLFKCAGDIPSTAVGTTDGGADGIGSEMTVVAHQDRPASFAAIHLQLHKKNKMYSDKYAEHILNYAKEWERILSTRIAKHLKQAEKLRVDLDHYGRKVEDLNKSMNKTMSKGKAIDNKNVDKIKRNEQKLIQARQEYDRFMNDLCGFMEEIMDRGWKDLHPLLVKMAQFDSTMSNEEAMLLKGSMSGVTEHLKGMGSKYPNLKPMGRLKELETWSLESLGKVNPSMRSDSPLMITQGGGEGAQYISSSQSERSESAQGIHAGLGGDFDGPDSDLSAGGGGGGGVMYDRRSTQSNSSSGPNPGYGQPSPRSRNNTGDSFDGGGGMFDRRGSQSNSSSGPNPGYGQPLPRSRNNTGDSYDWADGGGGIGSSNNPMAPALGAGGGSSNNLMSSPHNARLGSLRSPSSGGLPPLPGRAASFHEMPPQRQNSLSQDMSVSSMATSNMLTTMQAAAPPPTLGDIGWGAAPPPSGMPPPPPTAPPPPPPQSATPHMLELSLYDDMPHQPMPPSPMSQSGASGTNPFGDAFGGGSMASPPPPGAYGKSLAPTHGNPFGGAENTNPFG